MAFETTTLVRFAHVDPAGTVFYPRYFEMLNGAVEDWFAHMGRNFASMIAEGKLGTPIVKLDAEFNAPSRLGDVLKISFDVKRLGNASCEVDYSISCEDELRLRGGFVMVCLDVGSKKATPWPGDLRESMAG